jgi:hypothetical protein
MAQQKGSLMSEEKKMQDRFTARAASFDEQSDGDLDRLIETVTWQKAERLKRSSRDRKIQFLSEYELDEDITIGQFMSDVHALAVEKGWWDEPTEQQCVAQRSLAAVAIMHQGLSAVTERIRSGETDFRMAWLAALPQMIPTEVANIVAGLNNKTVKLLSEAANIHAEISEASEAIREGKLHTEIVNDKPEGAVIEYGDAVIRILDACKAHSLEVVEGMRLKHDYNRSRPYRHGKVV